MNYKIIYIRENDNKTRSRMAMSSQVAMSILKEIRRIHGVTFWAIVNKDNEIIANGSQ